MRADNTRHIVAAAQRRHEQTRAKAMRALRELDKAGTAVTFKTVANTAGVSRSCLYTQHDLRVEIERLRVTPLRAAETATPVRQRASGASLLRRLEAANERNRRLSEENRRLREQLAQALGDQRVRIRQGRAHD